MLFSDSLLASPSVYPLGRVVAYEEISGALFSTLRKITICGNYSQKEATGEVRLIETYTYGGTMIFIDTIKKGASGLELLHGVSVKETNNDHLELSIENLSCNDLGGNTIEVKGNVNGSGHDSSMKYDFTIVYKAHDGSYKYAEGP